MSQPPPAPKSIRGRSPVKRGNSLDITRVQAPSPKPGIQKAPTWQRCVQDTKYLAEFYDSRTTSPGSTARVPGLIVHSKPLVNPIDHLSRIRAISPLDKDLFWIPQTAFRPEDRKLLASVRGPDSRTSANAEPRYTATAPHEPNGFWKLERASESGKLAQVQQGVVAAARRFRRK